METSNKTNITNNLKRIVKSNDKKDYNEPISDNLTLWLEQSDKILKQIYFINSHEDYLKKQKLLDELKKEIKLNMEFIEYLITDDAGFKENTTQFGLLRHNYYSIQNQLLKIENDIISGKTDRNTENSKKISDKLIELEGKFEGLGATVITIILSITVISSSIAAIQKIPAELIPLFIVSMVWLGMTFLLFTNFIFRRKDTKILIPILFYLFFTLLFAIVLYFSLNCLI